MVMAGVRGTVVRSGVGLAVVLALQGLGLAQAQGIDCTKARTPPEKAICAAPPLVALDRQIAAAYAGAVARQPDRAQAMRQDTLRWLRARDAACGVPSAQLGRCLAEQMTARLAALAPPVAVVSTPAPQAAAVPPPVQGVPSAANPPAPAATVQPGVLPAAEQADALLRVTSPGRFSISARSATGVALQLVDMLTGPSDTAGEAGVRDGRLDVLLDVGAYRLRSFAAKGATGEVRLVAEPFRDAAPPRALPAPGEISSAALRDGEQLAFWLLVPPSGLVRIEAAGRALADLRLWRAGRELTALEPVAATIEPQPGHPMPDLRLEGRVEPGVYLAVAYGGPALPWADGSAAMPFHLRAGLAETLAEGWAGGEIGPFGSERYAAPAFAGVFRLDLPHSAAAELRVDAQRAVLSRTSREPHAVLSGTPGRIGAVEVRGAAGQAFTLRASEPAGGAIVTRLGTYWVSAVATGAGGDEAPPTVLLQRFDATDPPKIVAGNLPRLTPGVAWRGRFNLRGPTALLFDNAAGGAVTVRSSGVSLTGEAGVGRYDLPADYYVLRLGPAVGTQGVIDLTVGAQGASPAPTAPLPPDPVVPLGVQAIGPGQRLELLAQTAPGSSTGLSARPVPVALAAGPLAVTQAGGSGPLVVPVALAAGGALSVREIGGGAVAVQDEPGPEGARRVTLPGTDRPRTVVLAWRRTATPPADIPAPPAAEAATGLQPGAPAPFDLMRDEQRGFALLVPEGGLYRVETMGRLRTKGRIATAFIPGLGEAEANGVGQNMLLQQWLRAGRYRVDVAAVASAGHLAVVASPAPLLPGAALLPGGSVRASLAAGAGVAFPVRIERAGTYHLDLVGLGRPFTARLDDEEGWPVTQPGEMTELNQALRPGTYRLLVSPPAVARQVAARLAQVLPPAAIEGRGPHPLPFGERQAATWREPPGRADVRAPDVWTFSLAGPAEVSLSIADGMVGELWPQAGRGERPLARVTKRWSGRLEAGAYRVEASSLGRNDRLDYTLALDTKELQPGQVRTVTLPATVPFTLAAARVASLTTWGATPVRAVLRREDGTQVVRAGARADDWNVAISRLLPAGSYRLELVAAAPPAGEQATPQNPGTAAPPGAEERAGDDDKPDADDQAAQEAARRGLAAEREAGDAPELSVEVRLALPEALAAVDPPAEPLTGAGVHVLRVPAPAEGALLVAQGESTGAAVLALERQEADGWRMVALDEGRTPLVAALADGDARPWRVSAWLVDGGAGAIRVAVRAVGGEAQGPGRVVLRPVEGMSIGAARVRLEGPGVLSVEGAEAAAGWPGHAMEAVEGGQAVAQASMVWLVAGAPGQAVVGVLRAEAGVARVVAVPAGGVAVLAAEAAGPGRVRFWRAESGLGQPGFGGTAGVAAGSAFAPAGPGTVLRNAGGGEPLRVRATLLDLALLPERGPGAVALPPGSAVPVKFAGPGQVSVTLAAGVAAVADAAVVWGAEAALTRDFGVTDRVLLVNTGGTPASAAVSWMAGAPEPALRPGMVFKRFFGAAGSFDRAVAEGGKLAVAGDAELLWQGGDGMVQRGRSIAVAGAGRVVVSHGPGAVVLSLAGPGASPWPVPAARDAAVPGPVALGGAGMSLSFTNETPVLLHATTTAPVLLSLGGAAPELFAEGAELHRALPAGPALLLVYSPHDGPLSGTLALRADPIRPTGEGLGETVAVAPGGSAAFGFSLAREAIVGLGVRADPDRVEVRLLDARGAVLGEGVAQLRPLPAGHYVLEARVPPDSPPSLVRPAVLGITPQGRGPPADVAQHYLELVGLKPVDAR